MKTLYLHLRSYFDLVRFMGSANASELTVFFYGGRYLKIRRTYIYLLSLLNKNFPQNFLSLECNINLAPFRPSFITIIIIFCLLRPGGLQRPTAIIITQNNVLIIYKNWDIVEFIGRIQIPSIFPPRAKDNQIIRSLESDKIKKLAYSFNDVIMTSLLSKKYLELSAVLDLPF